MLAVTTQQANAVLKLWSDLPCANGRLVEYNPTLTSLLGCNTSPISLGAGVAAKAASFYLAK